MRRGDDPRENQMRRGDHGKGSSQDGKFSSGHAKFKRGKLPAAEQGDDAVFDGFKVRSELAE